MEQSSLEKKLFNKKLEIFFISILLLVGLFFSTYKLTESPPVWFDEGVFIQAGINMMSWGKSGMQVAPGEITSTSYITVGYPLIYPLSLAFKYFGIGIWQARAIMVIFILALMSIAYLFIKKLYGFEMAVLSSLLLVSFPPLYGHGKTVMGEVPGIFFLVLSLFFIYKLEQSNYQSVKYSILAGLVAGLCISTKPIFLILLPVILISIVLFRKKIQFSWKLLLIFLISLIVPIAIWLSSQFNEDNTIANMFFFYANPHGLNNYLQVITGNLTRFFTETTPIYFLILMFVWFISILIRAKTKRNIISFTELFSFCFCFLLSSAYLATAGFYRYFFPANIVALLFFPFTFYTLLNFLNNIRFAHLSWRSRWWKSRVKWGVFSAMIVLILVNFYHLNFDSWVASHYNSKKSESLSNYLYNYDPKKSIFFYNVPEAVVFLPSTNYYQYAEFTPLLHVGEEQLNKIDLGIPDEIIIPNALINRISAEPSQSFTSYQVKDKISSYTILEKIR